MQTTTRDTIIMSSIHLLASQGYEGTSMRKVAAAAGIPPSVIYHYFADKTALLQTVREQINRTLSEGMRKLSGTTAAELLRRQLIYQFENRELMVALLQYFIAMKADFPLDKAGYIPQRAYVHNLVFIQQGIDDGRYSSKYPQKDAKTISHLVNGYLLEYAGQKLTKKETRTLVEQIAIFIERSLQAARVEAIVT